MSADELLPLPEGVAWLIRWGMSRKVKASLDPCHSEDGSCEPLYTAAQVNEQSRANVAHATAGLRLEVSRLAETASLAGIRAERAEAECRDAVSRQREYKDLLANTQAELAAAREDAARLVRAGTLLSNIAFNLAQDDKLPESSRHSLDDARKRWDAAMQEQK